MLDTRVQLPQFSMWSETPIYEVPIANENTVVFGLMQDVVVPDPTDTIYTVTPQGVARLDLLAHNFYGVPDLWWVLARVNGIIDPLVGAPVGTVLRIPRKDRLAQLGVLGV